MRYASVYLTGAEVHIAMYLDFKINFILFISINHNNTYNCSDNFLNNEPR